MTEDSLKIETDKSYYLPGDNVKGAVVLRLEKSVRVQRLDVRFQGREKVSVHEGRASYSSSNEMADLALQFLENQVLTGDVRVPFQFKLPTNALPSFEGEYTDVSWKLSAKLDISWHSHIAEDVLLRVWTLTLENSVPVTAGNSEQRPKASLRIPSNIYQPGETIKGQLVVENPGSLRSIRVALELTEECTAEALITSIQKTAHPIIGQMVWKKEQLTLGSPIDFELPIPMDATTSYKGAWSTLSWNVKLTLDIPYADDVNIYAPFLVALRKTPAIETTSVESQEKIPVMVGAGTGSQTVDTAMQPSAPTPTDGIQSGLATTVSPSSPSLHQEDTDSMILKILGGGGSMDLLEIRSQLQTITTEFVDLNTVVNACDQLVEQGRLKRTGTGEFFAQYSLNTK